MTDEVDPFNVKGIDGILRPLDEHYDGLKDVESDPYGAWLAIQNQAARIAELEAERERIVGPASEVLRISDRDHPAWNELRAALGEKK